MSGISKLILYSVILLIIGLGVLWFIGGKKHEFETEATIEASPVEVFYFLKNSKYFPEWMEGLEEYDSEAGDILGNDDQAQLVFLEQGRKVPYEQKVIKYQNNQQIALRRIGPSTTSTAIFKLFSVGDQSTTKEKTKLTYKVKENNEGISRLMGFLKSSQTHSRIKQEILSLKKFVEANRDKAQTDLPDAEFESMDSPNSTKAENEDLPSEETPAKETPAEDTPEKDDGGEPSAPVSDSAPAPSENNQPIQQQNKPEEAFGFRK